MKASLPSRLARGAVALELSMVLGMAAIMAPCLIVLGNAMRQHMVMERVAYQSARQLATMPRQQMSKYASYQQAHAQLQAQALAALAAGGVEMQELVFEAGCLSGFCGVATPPQQVRVGIVATLRATRWGAATGWLLGADGLQLQAVVVLRYEN